MKNNLLLLLLILLQLATAIEYDTPDDTMPATYHRLREPGLRGSLACNYSQAMTRHLHRVLLPYRRMEFLVLDACYDRDR